MRWVLVALALLLLAPTAAACVSTDGKGGKLAPGDEIQVGDHVCTLAFLVVDPTGLYFTTAGHCVQVDEAVTTPGVGKWGVGAYHYLVPETGSEQDGAPGDDFALIRILPEFYDRVEAKVCGWGGPKGIYTDTPGGGEVHHYGWGVGISTLSPKRQGFNLVNNNTSFYWTGAGLPGDSGSAVLSADGRALGVLTHLVVAPPDTNGGTHLLRGFKLAETAGFRLQLVLEGQDPIALLAQAKAPGATPTPATTTPTSPTTQPSPSPTPSTPPPSGSSASPTPPPSSPTDETLASASDGNETPAPGFLLALLAVVLVALRRR